MKSKNYGSNVEKQYNDSIELYSPDDNLAANDFVRPMENMYSELENFDSFFKFMIDLYLSSGKSGILPNVMDSFGINNDGTVKTELFRRFQLNNKEYIRIPSGIILIRNGKTIEVINKPDPDFARRRFAKAIGLDINDQYNNVKINIDGDKSYLEIYTNKAHGFQALRYPELSNMFEYPEQLIASYMENNKKDVLMPPNLYYTYNCIETTINLDGLENKDYFIYYSITYDTKDENNKDLSGKYFISDKEIPKEEAYKLYGLKVLGEEKTITPIANILKDPSFVSMAIDKGIQIGENASIGNDLSVSGNTTIGKNLEIGTEEQEGDLLVNGNIYQKGEAYETHLEQLKTTKDMIITRVPKKSGDPIPPLGVGELTGITARKYDPEGNDGVLGFDRTGTARVGDVGNEQPIATREEEENMTDKAIVAWDAEGRKITNNVESYLVNKPIKFGPNGEFNIDATGGLYSGVSEKAKNDINGKTIVGTEGELLDRGVPIYDSLNKCFKVDKRIDEIKLGGVYTFVKLDENLSDDYYLPNYGEWRFLDMRGDEIK